VQCKKIIVIHNYCLHETVRNFHGIQVEHPRYLALPKVGMNVAPMLMAQAARSTIGRIIDEGYDFDADRRALFLSGRRGGGHARQVFQQAGGDHGPRHRHQPDAALPLPRKQ
jgi:hypothetical protein